MPTLTDLNVSNGDWIDLEEAARTAAIAGGISCMSYFRGALARDEVLTSSLNAATTADIQATSAILTSLADTIPAIAAKMNLGHSIFAEELELTTMDPAAWSDRDRRMAAVVSRLGLGAQHVKHTTHDFEKSFEHCVAVLFDALDGTTNFRSGLTYFCTAVALFLGGEPRVGAIYDPNRNVAYYGSLRTNRKDGTPNVTKAWSWPISAGYRLPLQPQGRRSGPRKMLATHLTRSKPPKRQEMIELLSALSADADGTFMINSGLLALALVAGGEFSAFVTNYTNTWDIAAGDALIRAAGGQVTDFSGRAIEYGGDTKVAVVATADEALHGELLAAIQKCFGTSVI